MVLYLLLFTLLAGQNGVFCKGNHSEGLSLRDSPSEVWYQFENGALIL